MMGAPVIEVIASRRWLRYLRYGSVSAAALCCFYFSADGDDR